MLSISSALSCLSQQAKWPRYQSSRLRRRDSRLVHRPLPKRSNSATLDPTFYNKVNKDVTSANQKIVKDTIQELITKQERPVTAENLIIAITTPRISYIYFKPKIHKPKYPDRPIVSACSCLSELISLTNTFHVAVRLFSNRSQMTSKCGKNKSGTRGAAEFVTDVLTTFWRPLSSITEQTHGNRDGIYLFYVIKN